MAFWDFNLTPAQMGSSTVEIPSVSTTRAPTANDDGVNTGGIGTNVVVGMIWKLNATVDGNGGGVVVPPVLWECTSNATGAATWALINGFEIAGAISDSANIGTDTNGTSILGYGTNTFRPPANLVTQQNGSASIGDGDCFLTTDRNYGSPSTNTRTNKKCVAFAHANCFDSERSAAGADGTVQLACYTSWADSAGTVQQSAAASHADSGGTVTCSTNSHVNSSGYVIGDHSFASGSSVVYADNAFAACGATIGQTLPGGSTGSSIYLVGDQTALLASGNSVVASIQTATNSAAVIGVFPAKTTRSTLTGAPAYNTAAIAPTGGAYTINQHQITGLSTTVGIFPGAAVTSSKAGIPGGTTVLAVRCSFTTAISANSDLTWFSVISGDSHTDITIAYTAGGALAVAAVGQAITVTYVSGVTTANAIILAVNASVAVRAVVNASLPDTSDGTGTISAPLVATNLLKGISISNAVTSTQTGCTITCTNNCTTATVSTAPPSDMAIEYGGIAYNYAFVTKYANGIGIGALTNTTAGSIEIGVSDAAKIRLTSSGLTDLKTRTANTVLSGPTSGGAAAPTYRALVAADLTAWTPASGPTQTANAVLAGPASGSAATPTFRALVAADISAASGCYSLFSHFADASNVTTGNTTLYTDALAAALMAANGNTIQVNYGLVTATTANTKQIRIYFGPTGDATDTLIFDSSALAITANGVVDIYVTIIRVGATTGRAIVEASYSGTGVTIFAQTIYTAITPTWANAQSITLTGTSSAASTDITAKLAKAMFLP